MAVLSRDETWRLVLLARGGDVAARNQVVEANLGLVRRYVFRRRRFKRFEDDALQNGVIGLMRAIELWDPARGAFSTYATHWVRQAVDQAYWNAVELIRRPKHVQEQRPASSRYAVDAERARHVDSFSRIEDRELHPVARPEREVDDRIDWVRERLADLPPMERQVIERVYGLDGDVPAESMATYGREQGWHKRTPSVLHHRAIQRLRGMLTS